MNLANKFSIARILLVPVVMFFYLASFIPYGALIGMVLFVIAAATDKVDGSIARKRNEVTDLGKLLDPIADKLLITVCFLMIVADQSIMAPYGVIALTVLIFRDSIVNALRQYGASRGIVFAAVLSGKLKAVFVYIVIPMFMTLAFLKSPENFVPEVVIPYYEILCYVMLGISTAITTWSAIDYSVKNAKLFKAKAAEQTSDTQEKA